MLSVTTLFPSDPPVDDEDDVDDEHAGDPRQARLQEMLRARLPRLIFTPAILAAILVVFVAMAATSGAVSFSSQTCTAGARSSARRSRAASGGAC
jgi:hypothetical protein